MHYHTALTGGVAEAKLPELSAGGVLDRFEKETSMDFQLTDRVVVITGAGSGIGLATAKTFLAEGAKVVAADLDPSAAGELSNSVAALTVDMSTPDGAGFVIAETMRMYGRVDVLGDNVGAFPF